jgi:hypothetical protein
LPLGQIQFHFSFFLLLDYFINISSFSLSINFQVAQLSCFKSHGIGSPRFF